MNSFRCQFFGLLWFSFVVVVMVSTSWKTKRLKTTQRNSVESLEIPSSIDDSSKVVNFFVGEEQWGKIDVNIQETSFRNPINYIRVSPPEEQVIIGKINQTFDLEAHLANTTNLLRSYYNVLKSLNGHCRKLYRAGGKLYCRFNATNNGLDGDKLICMDPEFGITGTNSHATENCLVLSFGIFLDTTFDESVRKANCEVFMFDVLSYKNYSITKDKYVHFHQIALGPREVRFYVPKENKTFPSSTLNNIVLKYGLHNRLINVLKIDIEGEEWEVLDSIVHQPFLSVVGQIAVELHSFPDNIRDPNTDDDELRSFLNLLLALEKRGFQRVAYWDNIRSHRMITDETDGKTYHAEGEMLLINTNWYKTPFRNKFRQNGFNFE